jgi:hypothetical protein
MVRPAGVGIAEPADPTVTVLVDPQAAYVEVVDPAKQHVDGGVDALVDRPPGDPKSGRDTSNGSAVSPTRPRRNRLVQRARNGNSGVV